MPDYRRCRVPGGTYFFTVNLLECRAPTGWYGTSTRCAMQCAAHPERTPVPYRCLGGIAQTHALRHHAAAGDSDFSNRIKVIKIRFVRALPRIERRSPVRIAKGERGIWQRRFWECLIRDDDDYARHVDYVHFTPVKHRHVSAVAEWPYSTFHRWVKAGVYPRDWGGEESTAFDAGERDLI
ncbi:MAG: REP-associated tyrosine transposase [Gammaproteobacteria bacterium]